MWYSFENEIKLERQKIIICKRFTEQFVSVLQRGAERPIIIVKALSIFENYKSLNLTLIKARAI